MTTASARFQLGIDLDARGAGQDGRIAPSTAHAEETNRIDAHAPERRLSLPLDPTGSASADDQSADGEALDHWVECDGRTFAGRHLIIDLWGGDRLDDIGHIDTTLRRAVTAAQATLLHLHLHHFTPNGGVSGVAVLAESHISIHTWPEKAYAALDVFMCGDADPQQVIPVLEAAFGPDSVRVTQHLRGDDEPICADAAAADRQAA